MKPPEETHPTFKWAERVNSTVQGHRYRLPTDYHVLIPLVIEGLPPSIEVRSLSQCREVHWTKGAVVYLKGGTDLICSGKGGGIYILIGGKNKAAA